VWRCGSGQCVCAGVTGDTAGVTGDTAGVTGDTVCRCDM